MVGVFLAVGIGDWLWTQYTMAVYYRDGAAAGGYSALIILLGSFVTLSYIQDKRYLIPAMIGAFLGTYLAIG